MSGRHRKARPSPNAAMRLARTGALTVVASAPLTMVTSGMAFATTGAGAAAPSSAEHHAGTRWDDSDGRGGDSDRNGDADDSGSHYYRNVPYSYDVDSSDSDSGPSDSVSSDSDHADHADAVDDPPSRAHRSSGLSSGATSTSASDAKWDRIATCESGQNWDADTGNGYKGGLQFSDSTWRGYGGRQYAPTADQASREQQIAVAKKVQRDQGWQAWPSCSRQVGYA